MQHFENAQHYTHGPPVTFRRTGHYIFVKKVGFKKLKNPKPFIDYSHTIHNVYENLEDYNRTKRKKVLIVF